MIVVDLETSGLDFEKNGIWQIGALELENPDNTFLQEACIDDSDLAQESALIITGKSEHELRDKSKQSQKQLLENFFSWASKIKDKNLIAHNSHFDLGFLTIKAKKYNLQFPFGHRAFDLHSIAAIKYFQINKEFINAEGLSKMNLSRVLRMCGLKDSRMQLKDNKIIQKGNPHNALTDTELEAECFYRIIYKKQLLDKFKNDKIPRTLLD